ncbi:acyl-CoA dehydrogenase family protein [Streptomyces sp. NPDC058464]|uniref:acyl-CoA dehydrogenase family protein n=1 Tax=Streptomyces sp. NPDC058464 TaxID=3346511 RepID=UPI003653F264
MTDTVTTPADREDKEPERYGSRATADRIRAAVAELVPLLRKEAVASDESGMLTPKTLQALAATGVFRIAHPLEYGGYALGARDVADVVAEVARGDGSAAWTVWAGTGLRLLLGFPEQAVDEVFTDVASWLGPLTCNVAVLSVRGGKARKVPGGWMVSGDNWAFASGCHHAAWALVGAEYVDETGQGRPAMAVLSRDQYRIVDNWKVMGLKGSSSNAIATDGEVFVPDHRFAPTSEFPARMAGLRDRYAGLGYRTGPRAASLVINLNCVPIALGMARGALECFVEQSQARKPFSLPYPSVAEMPATHITAAKAQAAVNAAQAVIERHADEVDRLALAGDDITSEQMSEMTMDLVHAVQQCADAIDLLQVTLGSSTVGLGNPIQRYARDIRVMQTHRMLRLSEVAELHGRTICGLEPIPLHGAHTI